jgi:hypothetical protein
MLFRYFVKVYLVLPYKPEYVGEQHENDDQNEHKVLDIVENLEYDSYKRSYGVNKFQIFSKLSVEKDPRESQIYIGFFIVVSNPPIRNNNEDKNDCDILLNRSFGLSKLHLVLAVADEHQSEYLSDADNYAIDCECFVL